MRTVTMRELDALMVAAGAVRSESARLSGLTQSAGAVTLGMAADGRPFDGVALGAKAVESLNAQREAMYRQFEPAAVAFTGEARRPGETAEKYFNRITSMSADDLLAAPVRNGLRLNLRGEK